MNYSKNPKSSILTPEQVADLLLPMFASDHPTHKQHAAALRASHEQLRALIAAAPDLLAACKAIEPHIADTHPPTENEHPYLTAVRQLRAAIAKAEGAE